MTGECDRHFRCMESTVSKVSRNQWVHPFFYRVRAPSCLRAFVRKLQVLEDKLFDISATIRFIALHCYFADWEMLLGTYYSANSCCCQVAGFHR